MTNHISTEPEALEGCEIEREARIDAAEDLKLEARRDRVKDTEREIQIEALEVSAHDLVETAKVTDTNGVFAKSGFSVQDTTKIVPAEKDDAWFKMTEAAREKYLQKRMGTYRPEGGVRALTRKRSRGSLKETNTLIDLGSAVLIKAGLITMPDPAIPRWCLLPSCGGLIDPIKRTVTFYDKSNPMRAHIGRSGISERRSTMWEVIEVQTKTSRWIERRQTADEMLDIFGR